MNYTKKTQLTIFIALLPILFLFASCEQVLQGDRISEGKIVFDITYLDDEKENPIIALLPSTVTLKFKDNNTVSNIEGFFGTFKIIYISDSKQGLNTSLLRVLDKKYQYQVDTSAAPFGYKEMKEFKIEKLAETKVVAGYTCQTARVTCESMGVEPFIICYTKDIDIENPNTNNPFKAIDGVLLEFQVKLNDINMKFVANKVVPDEIEDKDFAIPDGYKKVTKEEMEKILESFNNPPEEKPKEKKKKKGK